MQEHSAQPPLTVAAGRLCSAVWEWNNPQSWFLPIWFLFIFSVYFFIPHKHSVIQFSPFLPVLSLPCLLLCLSLLPFYPSCPRFLLLWLGCRPAIWLCRRWFTSVWPVGWTMLWHRAVNLKNTSIFIWVALDKHASLTLHPRLHGSWLCHILISWFRNEADISLGYIFQL